MASRKKTEPISKTSETPEITLFSATSAEPRTIDIEKTFEMLDTIIEKMESPGITLEASLNLYKQAAELSSGMKTKLEQIRAEIDTIGEEGT